MQGDNPAREDAPAHPAEAGRAHGRRQRFAVGEARDALGEVAVGVRVAGHQRAEPGQHAEGVALVEGPERRRLDMRELQAEEAPARLQHPAHLGKRPFAAGDVAQAEGDGHRVLAHVGEGQGLGVGHGPADIEAAPVERPVAPGHGHVLVDIDDDGLRALRGGGGGNVPGAAGDVQERHAGARPQRADQRRLPEPVDAETHQVVHQVVAGRHAVEHPAHKPGLVPPRHVPKAEIHRIVRWPAHARKDNPPPPPPIGCAPLPFLPQPKRISLALMPELPEVETVMRGLAGALAGRRLRRVEQRRAELRFPLPERFAARLEGRRIEGFDRRAKYILAALDDGATWLSHLGMSGRMMLGEGPAPEPDRHDHLIFETDDGQHLIYRDARRFGFMDLIAPGALEDHPRLAGLGIEPLGPELTGRRLRALFAGRRAPLKAALLDQRRIAGLGNIYVCEALNRARLHPDRPSGELSAAEARALAGAVRGTLEEAVAAGGSSLRDYVQASGELGYFQHSWRVYGREGSPCPCGRKGAVVQRSARSGRSTFFCPVCQK